MPSRALALVIAHAFLLLPAGAAAGESSAATGREADLPLAITVTPNRRPTPRDEVASAVTVVSRREMEARQQRTVADVLRDVPGVSLVQTGGPGGAAQVLLRGANAAHTKVMIDGVAANDPSDANGAFDFGPMLTADVERIEVLRGPQSGLYGSDAIGGVVNIVTRTGRGPARIAASVEGGSFATVNQSAGLSGSTERFDYAFSAIHLHAGDTPVTPAPLLPPGRRALGQWNDNMTWSSRLGARLTEAFEVGVTARYVDSRLHYTGDDFSVYPSVPAAMHSRARNRQWTGRAEGRLSLLDGRLDQRFGVGLVSHRRQYDDPGDGALSASRSVYRGGRIKADWQAALELAGGQTLITGAEHASERLTGSPASARQRNTAGYAMLQSSFGGRFFNTLSLRGDEFSSFGGAITYRAAPTLRIAETGTRLKATYGTGFKAPNLNQLYVDYPSFGFFANPALRPERSRGWDAGFEQALPGGAVEFGGSWFHNTIRDMIVANSTFTTMVNSSRVTSRGAEAFLAAALTDDLRVRADYTFTLTRDAQTGAQLRRRPRHKAGATLVWQPDGDASLSLSAVYVGPTIDATRNLSDPRVRGGNYTTVNLAGSYRLSGTWTAFARAENIFDRRVQDPVGFLVPGFGVFVGLKMAVDAGTLAAASDF